jgi:uncharacterized HAD superfamily protein
MVTDMDGVLCEDCPPGCDDDGPLYAEFLRTARPFHLPRRQPVGAIITARLEKYRDQTEAWLARHRVQYEQLVMWDSTDAPGRWDPPMRIPAWKAAFFEVSRALLFVESDPRQAQAIRQLTGKPVVCTNE